MITLALTFLPSILILAYFIFNDKFREPLGTISLIFFLGFLICLPAGILNEISHNFFFEKFNYSENLTASFLGPAWAEELLKFFILYFIVLKRNEFNEPMDGLVYGVVVSLGFATYENYTYVYEWAVMLAKEENFSAEKYSYIVALARSYSAVPMHGLNGAVMGYYFGMYVFTGNKKYLYLSITLPYLFHGFYNFLPFPFSMIVIGVLTIMSFLLHNDLKKKQKLKKYEREKIKI